MLNRLCLLRSNLIGLFEFRLFEFREHVLFGVEGVVVERCGLFIERSSTSGDLWVHVEDLPKLGQLFTFQVHSRRKGYHQFFHSYLLKAIPLGFVVFLLKMMRRIELLLDWRSISLHETF